jgi:hypothetical protein
MINLAAFDVVNLAAPFSLHPVKGAALLLAAPAARSQYAYCLPRSPSCPDVWSVNAFTALLPPLPARDIAYEKVEVCSAIRKLDSFEPYFVQSRTLEGPMPPSGPRAPGSCAGAFSLLAAGRVETRCTAASDQASQGIGRRREPLAAGRIVSREWLNWLHKGPSRPAMGVGSKCTAIKKSNTTDTGLSLGGKPHLGLPDGVYSYGEVL